ncbi:MAG: 2-C-methyl-D-erythritol 2,4-cyclodiphosphate synthase [Oscillospiraceae bacterium]
MRIGHGYDVHKLTTGRDLILGGIKVPFERGLLGHSDADVLTHALMDALLGAAALGDIGKVFPDNDPTYKNISSLILLDRVVKMVAAAGYRLGNADCTIIAQAPKLAAFLPAMRSALANTLGVLPGQINVKATTEEHLGFTGREEGIAAHAVVLLESL